MMPSQMTLEEGNLQHRHKEQIIEVQDTRKHDIAENKQDDIWYSLFIHGLEGYAFHSKGPEAQFHNCRPHSLG